ncbi:MAG: DUF885 family protein [Micromonosporaceae bacterium]|nr:DUF885 family protein [Micromonosporaceae bacterium]
MGTADDATLARLSDDYFQAHYAANPFAATTSGIAGFDAEVPDPSREADQRVADRLGGIAAELSRVAPEPLGRTDRVTHAMLTRLLRDQQETLRHGLGEVAASATLMGALAGVLAVVPTVRLTGPPAAEAYLSRLGALGGYFDRLAERHRQAAADGRFPTALGVRQAIDQLDSYLGTPPDRDPLLRPEPDPGIGGAAWRARAGELVATVVRPALARYRQTLADQLLPVGRPGEAVGVCHVPGGTVGYLALARAHTTTDLTPEEIHETGLALVAELRDEFGERGGRVLGTGEVPEVLRRLRDDQALRFTSAGEIVATVEGALRRAEEALPGWFQRYDIAPCVVREMDPVEAEDSVLGYYQPPAADGSRPGAHVVNTYQPPLRPRFEYETLAFHESVPGHHLQFAIGQSLTDLPDFRRFAYVTAYGEGWGLYTERLCDEMGLYTSDLSRLGMVSFDAWRACRLVVDTGMHHFGWSRDRAIGYLRENTALSELNIANEVDRYIAEPGQALAYMIGRLRIGALRDRVRAEQGAGFDYRDFHHRVLSQGSVPLDTLDDLFP